MASLSLEAACGFGLSPPRLAEVAGELGCRHITTVLEPFQDSLEGHPRYSLRSDKALRSELIAVMHDQGVSLSSGEGICLFDNIDVREVYPADLEIMHELGIPRINVVSFDPDLPRTLDQLALLTEMAADAGMQTLVEFVPIFTVADLSMAVAAVEHVGRPECRIMFDTMHFCRSGGRIQDIEALDPGTIGYIQLCDVPLEPVIPDYMEEAMYQRAVPGEGELPLLDILRALPRDRVVGLEIPLRSQALAGEDILSRMERCVRATKALLAEL